MLKLIQFILLPFLLHLILGLMAAAIFGGVLRLNYGGWGSVITELVVALPVGWLLYRLAPVSQPGVKLLAALIYIAIFTYLSYRQPDQNLEVMGDAVALRLHWQTLIASSFGLLLGSMASLMRSLSDGSDDEI